MRKFAFLFVAVLYLSSLRANASHIFGGELYYRHLSGFTYEINVALYGDCNGLSFPNLYTLKAKVILFKENQQLETLELTLDNSTNDEITPVCSDYKDSTQCSSPLMVIYGVRRFIYRTTVTLPGASSQYKFLFDGVMNNAGRTNSITNLAFITSSLMYLEAELDNTVAANSSPQFTTVPTPFYCINTEQEYNQGALDADGDSLVFALSPALDQGGVPAVYHPNYSPELPLETGGAFTFNSLNGQMVFTPSIMQSSVVVNKVFEYRNGKVVGSTMREMTFIVLNRCNNIPVKGGADNNQIVGGRWSSGNTFNVCTGTGVVSFKYDLTDPDGDTVDVSIVGLPAGATANISNNETLTPSFVFTWNTAGIPAGNYTFFVTAKDRHCPISSSQTRGFTVRIVDNYEISKTVTQPTNCYSKAVVSFDISNGVSPYNCLIKKGGIVVRNTTDSGTTIVDSFSAGDYVLSISSPYLLCNRDFPFTVTDSGEFPFPPLFNNPAVCFGGEPAVLTAIPYPGASVLWYDVTGNILPTAPLPGTSVVGSQQWFLSQKYKVCESAKKQIEVVVSPKPVIRLMVDTGSVCVGEKILLKATGADTVFWLPERSISFEPDGAPFIRVYEPGEYFAVGRNETGCDDTTAFGYNAIEPCCNFSYPSAFTPNSDGKNDVWRPIVYGNQQRYELSIYNRWGTRLFHSFIPHEGWDGRHNGQLQGVSTYFYFLKATCVTGKEELHRGEFSLIR